MRRFGLLSALLLCSCGDNIQIAPDAFVEGDPPTTTASPVPGVYRDGVAVTLTADEDARIYYTLDGTTPQLDDASGQSPLELGVLADSTEVRFFAIDSDQDAEAEHAVSYVIDRFGPSPVTGLTTAFAGVELEVRWTAPTATGFVDAVVVETEDVTGAVPEAGMTYAVGDVIGTGTVVYAGTGDRVVLDAPAAGGHAFLVWARYDTGEYSEARATAALVNPTQTAQLSIDVQAETGSVTTEAANVTLAVSNINRQGQDLSFDLTATSGYTGVVWNPKAVVTSIANGTFVGDGVLASGPHMGVAYRELGAAWVNGAAVTRTMDIQTASGTLTLDLAIDTAPGVYAAQCSSALGDDGGVLIDRTTGAARSALPRAPTGVDGEGYHGVAIAPDGHHAYAGTIAPAVVRIDLTDGTIADTLSLGTSGAVVDLRLDPSGQRLYAVVDDAGALALVEIEPGAMTEVGRLDLGTGGAAHALELSRDARWAAIATEDAIHVVDLSAWIERDADPADAAVQPIATPAGFTPTAVQLDAAGRVLVINGDGDRIGAVDLTDATLAFDVADRDGDPATATIGVAGFVPITNGMGGFWLLGDLDGMTKFVPDSETFTANGASALVTLAGRVLSDGSLETLSATELGTFDASTGAYTASASLPVATCDRRLALTPY